MVEVPQVLRDLAKPLEVWIERIVDRLRRQGYYSRQGHITAGGLQEARNRISIAIGRQESIAYRAAVENAIAMRLNHIISYILCQGVAATREALDRLDEKKEDIKTSAKEFVKDPRIKQLRDSGIPRMSVPKFLIAGKEPQGRSIEAWSEMIEQELNKKTAYIYTLKNNKLGTFKSNSNDLTSIRFAMNSGGSILGLAIGYNKGSKMITIRESSTGKIMQIPSQDIRFIYFNLFLFIKLL